MKLKESLLENNSILIKQEASNWEEAIKLGTDRLVEAGAIKESYYKEIIKATKIMGPYYLLLPGIAMPHSRPEAGVIKNCFAITILKNPVKFSNKENEYAQIFFTLGATSADAHAEVAIPQIIDLLDNEENIQKLLEAESVEEVLSLIE